MQDRIPTMPGRVKLTKEGTSSPEYFYMEMADEPAAGNEGTPLDKAHLLTDTTIAEILAKCGMAPTDINTAFSIINTRILKVKQGTFQGSNTRVTRRDTISGYTPSSTQTLSGFGFDPIILILGGNYNDFGNGVTEGSTLTLIRGVSNHSYAWVDGVREYLKYVDVTLYGPITSISWGADSVSWTGSWEVHTVYNSNNEAAGYDYTLFDLYNISGRTYRYVAIGL